MAANIFGQGRRRLTLFYSLIMCVFLIALIFIAHKTLEWSIFSEQARELLDTAGNVAEAQAYFNQHPGLTLEDAGYKSTNDRLFFYVFNQDGRLSNFARASFHIEPFILDVVSNWQAQEGEVSVFGRKNEREQVTRIMMTAKTVVNDDGSVQTVYVGKDVTAMYNGLQKSTYAMVVLGIVALLLATVLGHILSGRAMVPLREAYEKQRQFAADASHELRTPLAVIADVRDEVKKMTRLVSDLLLVARSDNKALKLKLQKFDAAELLSQTARLMQPLADKKHIALDIRNCDAHVIQADEQKIKQLMLILVDNAVKYTPDGGEVHVGFEKAPQGRVRFFVQDTGIGIAKEDQRRIFDRFYRVDKARSREMGGNGLGLSIAQEIVNLHQGSIEVTSTLGKGTRFTVELRTKAKAKTA